MTPTQIPPADPGNQLLAEVPAQLTTAIADTPAGKRLVMTIRTPSTTVTVFLDRDDARAWGDKVKTEADQMGGLTVVRGAAPTGLIGPQGV